MFSIRNINPMVRAVGTMGAVAALVGGITFAQVTSNTVTLANNTLSSANAALQIGLTNDCSDGTNSVQGMNFNNLVPGTPSAPFAFCVKNAGNAPLNLTAAIPGDFSGSAISPANVTLHFTCGVGGATTGAVDVSTTVAALNTAPAAFGGSALNNGTDNVYSCNVTAALATGVSEPSNAALTPFNINFVGTTPES